MENGVKDVKTPADGARYVKAGLRTIGTREKTRRGTASHKTEANDGRGRANLVKRNCERQPGRMWKKSPDEADRSSTYHSRDSDFLTHRTTFFNLSRTLVVARSWYFSSSQRGRTQANHQGNTAGSVGASP